MALLELKDITKSFGGLVVLDELNLEVNQGEIIGLIGPNGSGKTTTFNVITGYLGIDEGHVLFKEKNITGFRPDGIANLGIIRTFQLATLFMNLSVLDNILIGLHRLSKLKFLEALFFNRSSRKKEDELLQRANEILAITEMDSQKNKLASDLSAGWRKTLAIAIALSANPTLLLLDEPVCTLSPTRVSSIMNLIKKFRDSGVTIMIIEHDMEVIMNYCDRIVVLGYGRKICDGTPEKVREDREVINAYLGA